MSFILDGTLFQVDLVKYSYHMQDDLTTVVNLCPEVVNNNLATLSLLLAVYASFDCFLTRQYLVDDTQVHVACSTCVCWYLVDSSQVSDLYLTVVLGMEESFYIVYASKHQGS